MKHRTPGTIELKRAYLKPSRRDGTRILVDRLWPRGLNKKLAKIDLWMRDAAPSPALRKWFGHDPARWRRFCERYRWELEGRPETVRELRQRMRCGALTFVYAARDEKHNNAVALKAFLEIPARRRGR